MSSVESHGMLIFLSNLESPLAPDCIKSPPERSLRHRRHPERDDKAWTAAGAEVDPACNYLRSLCGHARMGSPTP